jgi:Cu-Zn family superoxide dismutase
MRKIILPSLLIAMTIALLATTAAQGSSPRARLVHLHDAEGNDVGTVRLAAIGTSLVRVRVAARGLPAGFHGFHIHAVGLCEPPFTSAGGHLNTEGASHPGHDGDMPVLYVTEDGTGRSDFITDRFTIATLFDADGSAVIVHAKPDNYANIPTDRYDPDPDAMTLATGDAGPRIACGVIEPAGVVP